MSYAAYMDDGSGFATNALRFETEGEAEGYAKDLFGRWLAVKRWEVRQVGDPVTHIWSSGGLQRVPDNVGAAVFNDDGSRRVR